MTFHTCGGIVVSADVIISNFDAAGGGVSNYTAYGADTFTEYKAFGFTIGNNPYLLDNVLLSMDFPTADANPIVSIWSGSSAPEVELIVLDNPIGLVGQTDFSFTPSSAFVLSANNTYWIHLRPEIIGQGPNYYWIATAPATIPFGTQASAVGFLFNDSPSGFLNGGQQGATHVLREAVRFSILLCSRRFTYA